MIKYIGTNELKSYHAGGYAPLHVILKEPHARIADHKPTLPSNIIFEIPLPIHEQSQLRNITNNNATIIISQRVYIMKHVLQIIPHKHMRTTTTT